MATVYYPGCPPEQLPFYICDDCADYENGKVRSAGYVSEAYYSTLMANPTSTQVWLDGIESEDIIIIPRVIGSLDVPDPATVPGYGDEEEQDTTRVYTLAFRDPNYKGNCNFYNTVKRRKNFHVIYRTSTQTHVSDKVVKVRTSAPITETSTDVVEWNVANIWTGTEQPCPFDTPEGVFDCFALQD
jgi:hypothetical protein